MLKSEQSIVTYDRGFAYPDRLTREKHGHYLRYAEAMLDLYRAGLPIEKLVTHQFSLCQATQAYRAMAARETGKVLLTYDA